MRTWYPSLLLRSSGIDEEMGRVIASVGRIALVAKPWRGGLGTYVGMALEELFPGRVLQLHTYPDTAQDKLRYRLDRKAWRSRLTEHISNLDADVILFLNLLPEFAALPVRPGHIAWLTDSPEPALGLLGPFSRVFISDPGYEAMVTDAIGTDRYAGVLPFACQPLMHRWVARREDAQGFCFIANRDAKRDHVLRYLFENGRSVHVYGNYFLRHSLFWHHPSCFRPSIANRRMGAVYARYLASLNIHAEVVRCGTNMRTFECAAYGVPQLVEYRPGLEALFDIDREIYVFNGVQELFAMMEEVEADVGEAHARAARAYERALAEHTYAHRIREILTKL